MRRRLCIMRGIDQASGFSPVYIDRAKSKHSCRTCKRGILRGEARLNVAEILSTSNGSFPTVLRHCLPCAVAVLRTLDLPALIKMAEEKRLKDEIKRTLKADRPRYVAKELAGD